jgi:hypothetical protein
MSADVNRTRLTAVKMRAGRVRSAHDSPSSLSLPADRGLAERSELNGTDGQPDYIGTKRSQNLVHTAGADAKSIGDSH